MNLQTQLELFDQYTSLLRSLMQSKGSDYAGNSDKLSNFKTAASLTNQTPSQQCLSMIATKVSRLSTLLASPGITPNNEPVKDSCLDGALYFVLLAMLEYEAAQERDNKEAAEEAPTTPKEYIISPW